MSCTALVIAAKSAGGHGTALLAKLISLGQKYFEQMLSAGLVVIGFNYSIFIAAQTRQRNRGHESTVAVLWPEHPLIAIIHQQLAVSGNDPACLVAKAKCLYFNNLQNDSSDGHFRIRRFSIFKPGFDSR